jgi:hypothetical protein
MEAKMFSVLLVRLLYHKYEASSKQQWQLRSQLVQYDPDEWSEEWIIEAEEYERSPGELTKCNYKVVCELKYGEIVSIIINCNSAWYITNKSSIESRIRKLFDVLPA